MSSITNFKVDQPYSSFPIEKKVVEEKTEKTANLAFHSLTKELADLIKELLAAVKLKDEPSSKREAAKVLKKLENYQVKLTKTVPQITEQLINEQIEIETQRYKQALTHLFEEQMRNLKL